MTNAEKLKAVEDRVALMDYNSQKNIKEMYKHFDFCTNGRYKHITISAIELIYYKLLIENGEP